MVNKKTGTTTLGLVCKDCVVIAADAKSTLGYLVSSKNSEKVYQIDDKLAVTTAGGAGDTQALIRIIRAEIKLYKLTRNNDITVKAASTLLANVLQSVRYYPYMAMLIVGGADKEGFHVFSIDPVGGVEEDKYTSTGSGSPIAYGVLEEGYKENMSREEGVRLAIRSIRAARERDIFSGGREINVAVIDKDGLKFVESEKVKEIAK
ncbi:MAG: archaeal proteasome endopeptidase complex subunit beta [Candidatus Aenigmarchaeota archaeon]|nr:archaeal proteasome endopeptidase complex subunit beta [Candidatus Aenigmarchaeota archaeon]